MSRATPDDQLKFLLSCVRHSNNGKIDFIEVADECGIVSKGAAAKRYERLLKANGIHPSGGTAERFSVSAPKQKSKAEIAKSAAAKRRKLESDAYDVPFNDEDEFRPLLKREPMDTYQIKSEPDTGIPEYRFQAASPSPRQPFFPNQPMTHFPMHNPFSSQYMQSHRPAERQSMSSGPIYTQTQLPSHPVKQHISIVGETQNISTTPTPVPVSEDQIQSMFDEFCSQDMFKQPSYDAPKSADTSASASLPTAMSNAQEQQLFPHAAETFAATSLESKRPVDHIKEEIVAVDTLATVVPEPTGEDIDNSILIAD